MDSSWRLCRIPCGKALPYRLAQFLKEAMPPPLTLKAQPLITNQVTVRHSFGARNAAKPRCYSRGKPIPFPPTLFPNGRDGELRDRRLAFHHRRPNHRLLITHHSSRIPHYSLLSTQHCVLRPTLRPYFCINILNAGKRSTSDALSAQVSLLHASPLRTLSRCRRPPP
jgi:hypothetical protein